MADPKHPKSGELVIDASDIITVDLTAEQIRGLTKTREGFGEAVECLKRLSPEQIQTLGLNPAEITRIAGLKVDFDRASELLGPAEKMVELLRETRMYRGHQVGLVLSEMANQARHRGEKDAQAAQLLGMLGDLMSYIYGPAQKGAAARRDREESEPPAPSGSPPALP